MIASDDPVHLHQRRLVNRRFTPRAVKAQSDTIADMIDKLVDPLTPQGRTEVIEDLAGQLPARFTAWLLGLDEDEAWPTMKVWSERLGYGTHFCVGANFAHKEFELLFAKLTRTWTDLRVVTEPDVELNHFARAVRSFELAFGAR